VICRPVNVLLISLRAAIEWSVMLLPLMVTAA